MEKGSWEASTPMDGAYLSVFLLLLSIFLLGWGEKNFCCELRAMEQGQEELQLVGCEDRELTDGQLVLTTCPLLQDGLANFSLEGTDWENILGYVGTGLAVEAELLQCIENFEGFVTWLAGGSTYILGWSNDYIDDELYRDPTNAAWTEACGMANPAWPEGSPKNTTYFAEEARIGSFTIKPDLIRQVPLTEYVDVDAWPTEWSKNGSWFITDRFCGEENASAPIGTVRVRFWGTPWQNSTATVLGLNRHGVLQPWTAESTWLCSGYQLTELRMGAYSKESLFQELEVEKWLVAMCLRLLSFFLIWVSLVFLLSPLDIVAECASCFPEWMADAFARITMCIACLPACGCTLGVVGIVWVVMRPLLGITGILIFCCCGCGFAAFKAQQAHERKESQHIEDQLAAKEGGSIRVLSKSNLDKE